MNEGIYMPSPSPQPFTLMGCAGGVPAASQRPFRSPFAGEGQTTRFASTDC
jgi:hypothetical protein